MRNNKSFTNGRVFSMFMYFTHHVKVYFLYKLFMCFGNVKLLSTVTSRSFLELLSFTEFEWKYDENKCLYNLKCDALRNLVPFVQFKKRKKRPWRSVNFSKVAGFSNAPQILLQLIHHINLAQKLDEVLDRLQENYIVLSVLTIHNDNENTVRESWVRTMRGIWVMTLRVTIFREICFRISDTCLTISINCSHNYTQWCHLHQLYYSIKKKD